MAFHTANGKDRAQGRTQLLKDFLLMFLPVKGQCLILGSLGEIFFLNLFPLLEKQPIVLS